MLRSSHEANRAFQLLFATGPQVPFACGIKEL